LVADVARPLTGSTAQDDANGDRQSTVEPSRFDRKRFRSGGSAQESQRADPSAAPGMRGEFQEDNGKGKVRAYTVIAPKMKSTWRVVWRF
jgi:hypothetical protein